MDIKKIHSWGTLFANHPFKTINGETASISGIFMDRDTAMEAAQGLIDNGDSQDEKIGRKIIEVLNAEDKTKSVVVK